MAFANNADPVWLLECNIECLPMLYDCSQVPLMAVHWKCEDGSFSIAGLLEQTHVLRMSLEHTVCLLISSLKLVIGLCR